MQHIVPAFESLVSASVATVRLMFCSASFDDIISRHSPLFFTRQQFHNRLHGLLLREGGSLSHRDVALLGQFDGELVRRRTEPAKGLDNSNGGAHAPLSVTYGEDDVNSSAESRAAP